MKDFFLSFNKADKDWADWIAWTLEAAGYSVVYQNWDFRPGENFVLRMNQAIRETRQTVIVLSQNYLDAIYTQPEWAAGFAEDPLGNNRKLIPFRIDFSKPDALLSTLIYTDLAGLSRDDEAKLKVLESVAARIKPDDSPDFPGAHSKAALGMILPNLVAKPSPDRGPTDASEIKGHIEERAEYSPLFFEKRILSGYQFILDSRNKVLHPRDLNDSQESNNQLISRYKEIVNLHIEIYFSLCKRRNVQPRAYIFDIADTLGFVYNKENYDEVQDKLPPKLYTTISGSRTIKVEVSQIFRIADLLTRPESVKARSLYELITNTEKMRRMLNRRQGVIKLGSLGDMKLVTSITEKFDRFWRSAVPDLRISTAHPLTFIPLELNLSSHLKKFNSEFESILESALVGISSDLTYSQIGGKLRIYPPGTGVISLGITLKYIESINVEAVAQIAHNIEDLLFVDADGMKMPYHKLMLDIIDTVIEQIFKKEGIPYDERRWLPPTTTYSFRDDLGLSPEKTIDELAYLMALAPGNKESIESIKRRIERILRTSHWKNDGVLASAGQHVALLFIKDLAISSRNTTRRKNYLHWLSETHELVSAAAYAQQAFAEEIDKIHTQQLLDKDWLPESGLNFPYLLGLLSTMRRVMQAIATIKVHLEKQGAGFLTHFATDVWTFSSPVNNRKLRDGLNYILDWIQSANLKTENDWRIELNEIVRNIKSIQLPFYIKSNRSEIESESPLQEELEKRIMTEMFEIERILDANIFDHPGGSQRYKESLQLIRSQIKPGDVKTKFDPDNS